MKKNITIYTDGACRGNPGPGGWGAVLRCDGKEKKLFGGEPNTTNNRMELQAAISALQALTQPCTVTIITDSVYVQKGMTEWLVGWKKREWRNASRQPVKNADLWQTLDMLNQNHDITWQWVKGHSGDPGNDLADALANQGIDALLNQ